MTTRVSVWKKSAMTVLLGYFLSPPTKVWSHPREVKVLTAKPNLSLMVFSGSSWQLENQDDICLFFAISLFNSRGERQLIIWFSGQWIPYSNFQNYSVLSSSVCWVWVGTNKFNNILRIFFWFYRKVVTKIQNIAFPKIESKDIFAKLCLFKLLSGGGRVEISGYRQDKQTKIGFSSTSEG